MHWHLVQGSSNSDTFLPTKRNKKNVENENGKIVTNQNAYMELQCKEELHFFYTIKTKGKKWGWKGRKMNSFSFP